MGMQFMVIACASGVSHVKENVSFGAKIALIVKGVGYCLHLHRDGSSKQKLFLLL